MSHISVSFSTVFRRPGYVALSLAISFAALFLAVSYRNFPLLGYALQDSPVRFITIAFSLFSSLATNFTKLTAFTTVAVSLLLGINVALVVYSLKTKLGGGGTRSGGIGAVLGALGLGCASCGSFLLYSILGTVGASGVILALPLRGAELGIIATALLSWSIWSASKSISAACKLK